jgi:hypothetical protein
MSTNTSGYCSLWCHKYYHIRILNGQQITFFNEWHSFVRISGDQRSKRGKQKEVKVTFGSLTEKNLGQLKVLNSVVFPVHYNDKFYASLLHSPELSQLGTDSQYNLTNFIIFFESVALIFLNQRTFNLELARCSLSSFFLIPIAYYNDVLVGAVCCRLEKKDQNSKDLRLYIMTLGVLAPYRQLKIGKNSLTKTVLLSTHRWQNNLITLSTLWIWRNSTVEFCVSMRKATNRHHWNLPPRASK